MANQRTEIVRRHLSGLAPMTGSGYRRGRCAAGSRDTELRSPNGELGTSDSYRKPANAGMPPEDSRKSPYGS